MSCQLTKQRNTNANSSFSSRAFLPSLLVFLMSLVPAQETLADTLGQARAWSNSQGEIVLKSAAFSHYLPESKEAVLKVTGTSNPSLIKVQVHKLSKGDFAFLAGYMTEAQDIIKQTQNNSSSTAKLFNESNSRVNIMQAAERIISTGTNNIGAHFVYGIHGIRYGSGRDVKKAERSLKIVIEECELVRKFYPNIYKFTLTSAYNASAVAKGRTGLVASAAASLKLAASMHSGSVPMVLTHNARRLCEIAKSGSTTHADLLDIASRSSNSQSGQSSKKTLLISCACDDFGSTEESLTPVNNEIFCDYSCLTCVAQGSFPCPANCKVGKRIEKVRVQVAFDRLRNAPIMGTKNIEHLCSNKSCLKGRIPCNTCKGACTGDDAWLWNTAINEGGITPSQVSVVFNSEEMGKHGSIGVVFDPVVDLHEAMILEVFNLRLLKNYYEISDAGGQEGSREHTVRVTNVRSGNSRELTVRK
ncbi:hypothetical protein N9276_01020 [Rhodopirellula sp.]|nr:hypothetical protein [Rhodopirellula sp.]